MKTLLYYLFLLVAVAVIAGFILSGNGSLPTPQLIGISGGLILYVVAMALVGESATTDAAEQTNRAIANRVGFITGIVTVSIALLFQLFISHHVDYWLLVTLIAVNLSKIISLIYLNYKK